MPPDVQQLCRAELYRRVCEVPLSKLAPQLGISATALAAVCNAHQVPYPGSGYWTRRSLGLEAKLPPLPDAEDLPISIAPHAPKRRSRIGAAAPTPAVLGEAAASNKDSFPVQAEGELTRPHWLIAEWIRDHEKRRKDDLASRDEWRIRNAPPPFSELDRRRHRLLDAIFKAVEKRGGKISKGDKLLVRATIDGEKIDFQIREKSRQVKVQPEDRRSSYLSTDLVGTGRLVFAIRTYLRGRHNEEWKETDRTPLEGQLTAVVNRLFEGAQILKAWDLEQQEDRRRWAEEAARRAEVERRRKDDAARRAKLVELANQWAVAERLTAMLSAVLSHEFDPTLVVGHRQLGEWRNWAEAHLAELRIPFAGAEALFATISTATAERGWQA